MAAGLLFLIIFVTIAALLIFAAVAAYLGSDARDNRREIREARAETHAAKAREKIATKALRSIANGAGNPLFEAQDALDLIETTYTKELN